MKIDKTPFVAKTRKLKANWSLEAQEDLVNVFNDPEEDRIERLKKLKDIDPTGITDKDLERKTPSVKDMMLDSLKREQEMQREHDKALIEIIKNEARLNGED